MGHGSHPARFSTHSGLSQVAVAPIWAWDERGFWRTARINFMATQKPKVPENPVVPPSTGSDDAVVLERRTQRTQPPQMYQVVLLNDDFTPMEFVVHVIQEYFSKDRETATQIMLKIHLEGKGICGVYTRDVASTKVDQVSQAARQSGHPLQCLSEPVE